MKMSPPTHSEKRDFIRMRIETPASVTVRTPSGSEQTTISGMCIDLSGGGMLLELGEAFQIGELVEVEIGSDYGHKPMLKAKAAVSRVETSGEDDLAIDIDNAADQDSTTTPTSKPTFLVGLNIVELLSEQ